MTRPLEGTSVRLLAPVELTYPRGLVQAAMVLNYSRIPTFVPDYRHVLWRERYHNRLGLFCFLFPGYPNDDYPFGRRACDETLDPEPELLTIRDPRLRTAILPVYRIGFAAALGKPFSAHLERAGPRYGWPVVTRAGNGLFLRTDPPNLPGLARLTPVASSPATRDRGDARRGRTPPRHPGRARTGHARAPHRPGRPPARERPAIDELGRLRGGALDWGPPARAAVRTRTAPTPRPTTSTSPRSCDATWRSVTWRPLRSSVGA